VQNCCQHHLWLRSMGVASAGALPCRMSKMTNCPLYWPAPTTCPAATIMTEVDTKMHLFC
jgi:hypothetical protein